MLEVLNSLEWNKKIEVLRVIKGWSQREAAEKCNTNQKVFWSWETGERYPHKNNRLAIARAFEIDEEEIFSNKMGKEVC